MADKEHSMDHSRPRVAGWGRVLSVILKSVMTLGGAVACSSSSYFLVGWRYVAVALPPEELLLP